MTLCPRCGTRLLPSAAVCTACCHRLDGSAFEQSTDFGYVAQPEEPQIALPLELDEAHKVTQALTHWPFGGADEATIQEVTYAPSRAASPQIEQAPAAPATAPATAPTPEEVARRQAIEAQHAALATPDALGIPNQRSAAFNPIQITPNPPPNRYVEATRRQQANFGSMRFQHEESGVSADCG
jgi:hypothetical protein